MAMQRPLRIAVTADPEIPVPPRHYGGIERIVDLLARELVQRGHDVTLFAHPDSDVPCRLEPYPGLRTRSKGDALKNMWHISAKVTRGRYDLVHSFARLAYLLPVLPLRIPKLMSYQRSITPSSVAWGERLARGTLHFTGCSRHIVGPHSGKRNWNVVYNGVPLATYQFRCKVDDDAPLIFVGQLDRTKGPHLAIEIARRSGRPLIIAGNVRDGVQHRAFFAEEISLRIDGENIRYVGPVDDSQKNELLGRSAALLMPILWEEPFGIVMAEALACGTPVIGFNRGSVPEVVQDGMNGFVCETVDQMAAAVGRINEIERRACRRIMEEKFSDRAVVDDYEDLYKRLIRHRPAH